MVESQDFGQKWRDGKAIDRAMDLAFQDAVRRHRAANVPMAMWEDGEVVHVSPVRHPAPGRSGGAAQAPRARGRLTDAKGAPARILNVGQQSGGPNASAAPEPVSSGP